MQPPSPSMEPGNSLTAYPSREVLFPPLNILNNPLPSPSNPRCCTSLLAAPSTILPPSPSPPPVFFPPSKTLTATCIHNALRILIPKIPTITRLLFRNFSRPAAFASSLHPSYSAYVVMIEPRLPHPETTADAAATPTSPCRGWKISVVQVIVIGTVGPSPNPTIRRPP